MRGKRGDFTKESREALKAAIGIGVEDLLELPRKTAIVRLMYDGSLFVVMTLPMDAADRLLAQWALNKRRVSSVILRSVPLEGLAVCSITDCLGSKEWPVPAKLAASMVERKFNMYSTPILHEGRGTQQYGTTLAKKIVTAEVFMRLISSAIV